MAPGCGAHRLWGLRLHWASGCGPPATQPSLPAAAATSVPPAGALALRAAHIALQATRTAVCAPPAHVCLIVHLCSIDLAPHNVTCTLLHPGCELLNLWSWPQPRLAGCRAMLHCAAKMNGKRQKIVSREAATRSKCSWGPGQPAWFSCLLRLLSTHACRRDDRYDWRQGAHRQAGGLMY